MPRGDVHALTLPRSQGHVHHGRRYGVVVQSDYLRDLSTVVIAPTSTAAVPTIFRPEVHVRGRRTRVLAEQIGVVDRMRLGRRISTLSQEELRTVDQALALVLGLL